MGKRAIICLGNRYLAGDDVGCRVYDSLVTDSAPAEVEVIDGGLCGLDLLSLLEGKSRVVFADALSGMAGPGDILVLDRHQVAAQAVHYGHSAGLPFLLHMMAQTLAPPWPEVALVGAAGRADQGTVRAMAERCLEIARHGLA